MSVPSLAVLQVAFRAHVLQGDADVLIGAAVSDRISAAARLRVYRHHVFSSLGAALGATFSTVRGVVGEDFFAGMARAFVARSPPVGPVLSEYGAGFADFVATWPAAAGLPYLPDVARLDWALNVAYTAPDQPALTGEQLAAVPPERLGSLQLAPRVGVSLLRSRYPVDRIWALNHDGRAETVDLAAGDAALLVFPREDDAAFATLEPAVAALIAALSAGDRFGAAAERAMQDHPGLDLGTALGRLLSLQALGALA